MYHTSFSGLLFKADVGFITHAQPKGHSQAQRTEVTTWSQMWIAKQGRDWQNLGKRGGSKANTRMSKIDAQTPQNCAHPGLGQMLLHTQGFD